MDPIRGCNTVEATQTATHDRRRGLPVSPLRNFLPPFSETALRLRSCQALKGF